MFSLVFLCLLSFFKRKVREKTLLILEILVYSRGGLLARAHGEYYGSCAGNGVAAREYAGLGGSAGLGVCGYLALAANGEAGGRLGAENVSRVNSLPSLAMGLRRPEASGSPSSISMHSIEVT